MLSVRTGSRVRIVPDCTSNSADGYPTITFTDRADHGNLDIYTEMGYAYYSPDAGYQGADTVKFTLTNAAGTSAEQTVNLNVTPAANTAPYCYYFGGELYDVEGAPEVGLVGHLRTRQGMSRKSFGYCSDAEDDAMTLEIKSAPAAGTLVPVADEYGQLGLQYTPAAGAEPGTKVEATVFVKDAHGVKSAEFLIGFVVIGADENTQPTCYGSGTDPTDWSIFEVGVTETIFDAWCYDDEDDAVTLTKLSDPTGAVVGTSDQRLTVTPSASTGESSFTFKGVDSQGASSEVKTVGLRYTGEHSAPTCTPVTVAVAHATRTPFAVACSDVDGDDVHLYVDPEDPHNRSVAKSGDVEVGAYKDGKLQLAYTPRAGFAGADAFMVGGWDWFDDAANAKVTLNVASAGGNTNTNTNTNTPTTGGGIDPKVAMTNLLTSETLEFLQAVGGANKKGINAAKPVVSLGKLGADQLPNGGTGQFNVFDKPAGKKLVARAAAAKRKLLGATKVVLAKGQSKKVLVKLNKKGKALLKKKGKVKLTVDATLTDALTGAQVSQSKSYTFKVKKAKKKRK